MASEARQQSSVCPGSAPDTQLCSHLDDPTFRFFPAEWVPITAFTCFPPVLEKVRVRSMRFPGSVFLHVLGALAEPTPGGSLQTPALREQTAKARGPLLLAECEGHPLAGSSVCTV